MLHSKFVRYTLVGVVNTGIHWLVFAFLLWLSGSQAWSNAAGFLTAVTFSFFVNARLTFEKSPTLRRYLLYTAFMALMSYLFGMVSDSYALHPLITLVSFSAFSLVAGFLFADKIVFRAPK